MSKRALISVSDKTGIAAFASGLEKLGYEIISTGGTLRTLVENGIDAKQVESITQFQEILDGSVKTSHPYDHGALLAKRSNSAHMATLKEHDTTPIDIVVVNLYPFKETLAKAGVSHEE